ncbi:hypothetical protein A9Q99_18795 [Gammaproteobacteria bacterium 45_16_T64]|nr:hypothetical protein A9Q99_18795 [Gammaproteobacteria bacterium 45_16_T64]
MRSDISRLFMFAFLALFLTACKSVTVDNPVDGEIYTEVPDIQLSFPSGRPDPFEVSLNGADITAAFTVTDSGATAAAASISGSMVSGANSLKVVKPDTSVVTFTYDISGPVVHVTSVTDGATLVVVGYVEDPSGVASLSANGSVIVLDESNGFTANIAAANFIEFVAEDSLGYVSTQKYADESIVMEEAVAVRINRNGLDFMVTEVEEILEGEGLAALLPTDPILEQNFIVASAKVYALDATLGSADVAMNVTGSGGNFDMSGNFNDIWARYTINIDWPWPLPDSNIDGTLTLDSAAFTGDVNVDANNGEVIVAVNNLNLNLDAIRTDIENFPDWLLTPFYEIFEWLFEWILEGMLESLVPELVGGFLDTFTSDLELDLGGSIIKPAISPESFNSPNNGIDITLDSHIYALTSNGPKNVGSAFGSDATLPTPTSTTPAGDEKDVGMILSENAINQALMAATEAGVLSLSLGAADIPELGEVDTTAGNVRMRLIPTAAPTIDLVGELDAGLGTLAFNDFYIAFDSYNETTQEWSLFVGATMDVGATADLGITDNNSIALDLVGLPTINIRDIDDASTIALSEALVNALLEEFMPIVLPVVLNSVGAIPLPSFAGYSFNVGDLWVADAQANFVALAGDLVKAEATAAATASRTFARVDGVQAKGIFGLGAAAVDSDVVTIDVAGSEDRMAYRYSVDGAPFGLWKNRTEINLYGLRAGEHEVTVCSRNAMMVVDGDCDTVNFTTN